MRRSDHLRPEEEEEEEEEEERRRRRRSTIKEMGPPYRSDVWAWAQSSVRWWWWSCWH